MKVIQLGKQGYMIRESYPPLPPPPPTMLLPFFLLFYYLSKGFEDLMGAETKPRSSYVKFS